MLKADNIIIRVLALGAIAGIVAAPFTGGFSLIATAGCVAIGATSVAYLTKNINKQHSDENTPSNQGTIQIEPRDDLPPERKGFFKRIGSALKSFMNTMISYDEDEAIRNMGSNTISTF